MVEAIGTLLPTAPVQLTWHLSDACIQGEPLNDFACALLPCVLQAILCCCSSGACGSSCCCGCKPA